MVERQESSYVPNALCTQAFLETYLRNCIHLNDPDSKEPLPRPYEFATITQVCIDPNMVLPTSKYVLRSNLDHLLALEQQLLAEGIDPYQLSGIIQVSKHRYMCPPILEQWSIPPFNNVPVIVDGGHRLFLARQRGISVNCVLITGNISFPLPVLPLPGWDAVHVCDDVPQDKINPNPVALPERVNKLLHRQQFPGSTGHRPCPNERVID